MPFKSEKQRRFLWAEHPEIAKRWAHKYPKSNKGLPMYAHEDKEKKAALSALSRVLTNSYVANKDVNVKSSIISATNTESKTAADGLVYVPLPKKHGPSYAGEERESGIEPGKKTECAEDKALDDKNPVAQKLAVVLGPKLREFMEHQQAAAEGRPPLPVPQNLALKRYAVNPAAQQMPPGFGMPMQQPGQPQPAPPQMAQAQPMQPPMAPQPKLASVQAPALSPIKPLTPPPGMQRTMGGQANGQKSPTADAIQMYGPLRMINGRLAPPHLATINGNAAFGQKNSPDSMKFAAANTPCSCKCGDTVSTCKCGPDCKCRKPGGSCYKGEKQAGGGAWTRSEGKNPEGGLNAKGRASLKAQGHDIKAPVTESNPSGERAKRQNSFCSRMCGMKRVNTGSDAKKDPDSRINKSLRKWNCKCSSAFKFGEKLANVTPPTPVEPATISPWQKGYSAGVSRSNNHYNYNLARGALSGAVFAMLHDALRKPTEEERKMSRLRRTLHNLGWGLGGAVTGAGLRGALAAVTAPTSPLPSERAQSLLS